MISILLGNSIAINLLGILIKFIFFSVGFIAQHFLLLGLKSMLDRKYGAQHVDMEKEKPLLVLIVSGW